MNAHFQVSVRDTSHPDWVYTFPCGRWLAGDMTCADLPLSQEAQARESKYMYSITHIYTFNLQPKGCEFESTWFPLSKYSITHSVDDTASSHHKCILSVSVVIAYVLEFVD